MNKKCDNGESTGWVCEYHWRLPWVSVARKIEWQSAQVQMAAETERLSGESPSRWVRLKATVSQDPLETSSRAQIRLRMAPTANSAT